jgi:rRNA maturation protein Nop10
MIKKCSNKECEEEYDMHDGSNECPSCGERTDIQPQEVDTEDLLK